MRRCSSISAFLMAACVAVLMFSWKAQANEFNVRSTMKVSGLNSKGELVNEDLRPGDSFRRAPDPRTCSGKIRSCSWGVLIQVISSVKLAASECFCTSQDNLSKQEARPPKERENSAPVLVRPRVRLDADGAHGLPQEGNEEQRVSADLRPTKFPLKFFSSLQRLEPDGSLAEARNFSGLYIEASRTVVIGGKPHIIGRLFDEGRPFNDKAYVISVEEFNKVKSEQKWTQQAPARRASAQDLSAMVPGLDAEAFVAGVVPLRDRPWQVVSRTGTARGTEELFFKPLRSTRDRAYTVGTLHRKNEDGTVNLTPAYKKEYGIESINLPFEGHVSPTPTGIEAFAPPPEAPYIAKGSRKLPMLQMRRNRDFSYMQVAPGIPADVTEIDGIAVNGKYLHYNSNPSESENKDNYGTERTLCAIHHLLSSWYDHCVANVFKDPLFCKVQLGDISDGTTLREGSKCSLGHATHFTGTCFDFRPLNRGALTKGNARGNSIKDTETFIKYAKSLGADSPIWQSADHYDHGHLCFSTKESQEMNFQKTGKRYGDPKKLKGSLAVCENLSKR